MDTEARNRLKIRTKKISKFIINENTVIWVIVINAVALFIDSFPDIQRATAHVFGWLDYMCTVYFVVEMALKIITLRWRGYWGDWWNRFDFLIVVFSMPSLLDPIVNLHFLDTILILRLGRLLRFFKLLRFIPNGRQIWADISRALKVSVGIFLALAMIIVITAMGSTFLFGKDAPEHFGDPLISMYSVFKVFTVEGWNSIPDDLIASGKISAAMGVVMRVYFVVIVLVGGILGLSLANAVFVDQMTANNNERLENMVQRLDSDIKRNEQKIQQKHDQQIQELKAEMVEIKQLLQEVLRTKRK